MNRMFPVLKYVSIPNLLTSAVVVLALCCQALAINGGTRAGLTIFLLVLLLNKIDSILPRGPGQAAEFGRELRGLSEFLNFIVTPVVISYYIGFNSLHSFVFFALFLFAGIWRSADSNQTGVTQKDGKSCFRGLCRTHAGAIFLIVAAIHSRFFGSNGMFIFIPFFVFVSLLMISSFLYNRKGKLALSFYLLTPVSVILMWL